MRAEQIVNLESYPIADLERPEGQRLAADGRRQFDEDGFSALHGFIRPDALETMVAEANGVAGAAYYCDQSHTPYLEAGEDRGLDPDPRRRHEQTNVGSVAMDQIPGSSLLRILYDWDPLKDFIAAVLGKPELYRFADPLGACSINVFNDGGRHGWHFDESEFTITLMLQAPEVGGMFEYVPDIRGHDNEHDIVSRILDGGRTGVVEMPFTPGSLLIFGGRRTLHRVTTVGGGRPRLVPVLCYSARPDQCNSDEVRKLFWV